MGNTCESYCSYDEKNQFSIAHKAELMTERYYISASSGTKFSKKTIFTNKH